MAVTRRPVPPRIPGAGERAASAASAPMQPGGTGASLVPAAPRRISRRVAAAGIGAAALIPLGGIVAAALNGATRAPAAHPSTTATPPQTTAAPAPTPDPPLFTDVNAAHPDREAIEWAARAGILPGGEDGAFRPDEGAARSTFALALHRYAGAPDTALDSPVFTDLPEDAEAAAALQWAGARGILWGDADLAVRPETPLTRADLAAALMAAFSGGLAAAGRAVQAQESTTFADVEDADAATLPLRWATAAGALRRSSTAADGTALTAAAGSAQEMLVPQRGTTRAELAAALHAMQGLLAG